MVEARKKGKLTPQQLNAINRCPKLIIGAVVKEGESGKEDVKPLAICEERNEALVRRQVNKYRLNNRGMKIGLYGNFKQTFKRRWFTLWLYKRRPQEIFFEIIEPRAIA